MVFPRMPLQLAAMKSYVVTSGPTLDRLQPKFCLSIGWPCYAIQTMSVQLCQGDALQREAMLRHAASETAQKASSH